MDLSMILTDIAGVVVGGGLGAFCMQLYTARTEKKRKEMEVEEACTDIEKKKQDNKHDAFETVYRELNKCLEDYNTLSENYREHREKTRKYEEAVQEQIREKCNELAALKSKIIYLKGIRCYNTLCPNRIKVNPDKHAVPDSEDGE